MIYYMMYYMYMYTYIHTYIHTDRQTDRQTYIHTYHTIPYNTIRYDVPLPPCGVVGVWCGVCGARGDDKYIYIYMCGMVGMVSMSKLKKLKQKNAKTRWQLGGSWGEGLGGGGGDGTDRR